MHGTATIDNRDGHVIEGLRAPVPTLKMPLQCA
jgi:hypothetical protein